MVNVARASLDELLLDYEDFLRQRGKALWRKSEPAARAVRALGMGGDRTDRSDPTDHRRAYSRWLDSGDSAVIANAVICLIHQANYLLDRQIVSLEKSFVRDGGYTEQLAAARLAERRRQHEDRTDRSDLLTTAPNCPTCGEPMVLRTARKGARAGSQFWGCAAYPECNGARPLAL